MNCDRNSMDLAIAKSEPRTQAGQDAAARVLAVHRGLIVRLCNQFLMDGYDMDDFIQEAHLACLEAIRYYDPAKLNPKTGVAYLFTTYLADCVRRRIAKWRDDRRQRPLPQEGAKETLDLCTAPTTSVDRSWLEEQMASMPAMERLAIELRYGMTGGGEMTIHQVANRLGIGRTTAEMLILQGQQRIKCQVDKDE